MSITLKNYHGEDIASSMAKILTDKKFTDLYKQASFNKTAMTLEDVRVSLEEAEDIEYKWNELTPYIEAQEELEPGFYGKAFNIFKELKNDNGSDFGPKNLQQKEASFNKTAMTLEDVRYVLRKAKDIVRTWNSILEGILAQENLEPGFY